MSYPFKPVEHCIYQKTFLKDVRVVVEYSPVDLSAVNAEQLKEFLDRFNGADIKIEEFVKRGGVMVYTKDHNIEIRLQSSLVEVKIDAFKYTSFDNAIEFWSYIPGYLNALGIKEVSKITVRKYNALYFKSANVDYDIIEVMGSIFCDDLMALMKGPIEDKALSGIEKTWSKKDEASSTEVNVVFGIKKADTADKKDHLTLTLSVSSESGGIATDEVLVKAEAYNKILFDAFHWCVKKDIINNMK